MTLIKCWAPDVCSDILDLDRFGRECHIRVTPRDVGDVSLLDTYKAWFGLFQAVDLRTFGVHTDCAVGEGLDIYPA
ncbi:hypothetical protein E4T56_gene1306 [Termitomyces sp. T112]|nr:hypothetical protein E4T56_gene1306 [Termitomyces sp. T112]